MAPDGEGTGDVSAGQTWEQEVRRLREESRDRERLRMTTIIAGVLSDALSGVTAVTAEQARWKVAQRIADALLADGQLQPHQREEPR